MLIQNKWLLFATGLLTLVIGLYFRLYPLNHNVASDEYEQATMLVLSKVRASITQQVNDRFPQMRPQERQQLIQTQFNETLRKDNKKLRAAFDQVGQELLKKSGEKKHYLQESDSYYFLDLTQNILEKGDVSPTINGSQYFNNKMLAPVGYWEPQTWHPYIGAWVYKAVKFFNPTITLMNGLAFTPLVLLPFVIAAFFLACRGLGCSLLTTFTASIFFILAPIYLQRSTFAWYDNDTYSVLFPLLNLGFLFFALRSREKPAAMIFWGILAGLSFAFYARFWTGWGSSWGIALGTLSIITIRSFILKGTDRRNLILLWGVVAGTTLAFLVAMVGVKQFLDLIPFAFGELKKFTATEFNGWPDMFIIVGELHAASLKDVIMLTGGPLVFLGATATFIAAGYKMITQRKSPEDNLILLGSFTLVTFILALKAERFTLLLLTPLALTFAYGLEMLQRSMPSLLKWIKFPDKTSRVWIFIFCITLTLIPIKISDMTIASLLHPIFNSAWDRALTQVREKTPANSVVNTWWSPGHFVKAIAKRRVTFDGASIKGEQAYWLTKAYLSQNENDALGILRMLNTSANQATEFLQAHGWPLSRAVPLLTEITSLPPEKAAARLTKVLSPVEAKELLKLTHSTPPPSYMLIYNEIVDGNVLLGYVGKWDFAKIESLNNNREALSRIPSKSSKGYIDFLWDLVGGPLRQSETLAPTGKKDAAILFDQGVTIDINTMSAMINSPKFGRGIPASIVFFDTASSRIIEKTFDNSNLHYSVVFFNDKDNIPRCILMDRMLANSLIMKLYYFEGKGLEYFKPFAKEQDLSGRTKIFVYEVAWPKDF